MNKKLLQLVFGVILVFGSANFAFTGQEAILDVDAWESAWQTSGALQRASLVVDFFEYAFQPEAPTREIVLERLKKMQAIIKNMPWEAKDGDIQKAIEKIVNDEVILIDAAISMNIPNWCGTIATPYLTGDNIAFLCSHRTFKVNGYSSYFVPFDPLQVREGDSVFVVTNYLDLFFTVYHPKITQPYVLVTDNSDFPVPGKFTYFLEEEKILAWFCINPDGTNHSKLYPIPLGIRNHGYGLEDVNFMDHVLTCKGSDKSIFLYLNFTQHNQERKDVMHFLQNKTWSTFASNKTQLEYYKDVAKSKFVISPPGDGLDCWRTWETLLLGAFPIVRHSPLDSLFAKFPIVIVENWADITEDLLESKYYEFSQKTFDYNMLFAEFWGKYIHSKGYKKETL